MVPAVAKSEWEQKLAVADGCAVYQEKNLRASAKCFRSKDGRLFEIYDALDTAAEGWAKEVTVVLNIKNPENNWEAIGFKIRTYEMTAGGINLVDKLEGDALRPTLQCQDPCELCEVDGTLTRPSVVENDGTVDLPRYVRGYCTSCWQDSPKKYLMTESAYDKRTKTGQSTCLTACKNGWTSNGHPKHVCERCNPRCQSCEDQGAKGDKDLCKACSLGYPFSYGFSIPEKNIRVQTCFKECGTYPEKPEPGTKPRGLYKITSKACGACATLCLDCQGDKFNCTKCDVDEELALFQKKMLIGGTP